MKRGPFRTDLCIPSHSLTESETKVRLSLLKEPQFDELRFNIKKALRIRQNSKKSPKWLRQSLAEAGKSDKFDINPLEILLLYIGHQSQNTQYQNLPDDYKLLIRDQRIIGAIEQIHRSLYRKILIHVRRKLAVQELLASAIGDSYYVHLIAINPRYLKCEEILNWIHRNRSQTIRDQLDRLAGAIKGDRRRRPPKSDIWRHWLKKSRLQNEIRSIRETSGRTQALEAQKLAKRYGKEVSSYICARNISKSEVVNMLLRSQVGDSKHIENEIAKLNSAIQRIGFSDDEMALIECWDNIGFDNWTIITAVNFWPDLETLLWRNVIQSRSTL